MGSFQVFLDSISGAVRSFSISDFLDILFISFIIYKAIKIVRETRAQQLVKGIALLGLSYFVSKQFELRTMSFLLENFLQVGLIALIILFQPELRRVLEKVGRTHVSVLGVFNAENNDKKSIIWDKSVKNICRAANELSKTKTGALIVIERSTKLGEQIGTGVIVNANITVELLLNVFFVNTPLHDGAVIVRDGRLLAAACFLPKPQKEELIETKLGSRHRAAIGISEISDALTVVVSEETGTISVSEDGELIRNFTEESLYKHLMDRLVVKTDGEKITEKTKKKIKGTLFKK